MAAKPRKITRNIYTVEDRQKVYKINKSKTYIKYYELGIRTDVEKYEFHIKRKKELIEKMNGKYQGKE